MTLITKHATLCLLLCFGCTAFAASGQTPAPELVSVTKIWDQSPHCAFTDLIRFKDQWWCTFRESDNHVSGLDGKIRVIVSADGATWESAALLSEEGIDLRDPKLSITPDNRLMLLAGGSVYKGKELLGRQPRAAFSEDGRQWTPTQRILNEGDWLWRVTWRESKAYGVAINLNPPPEHAPWRLRLVSGQDGIQYEDLTYLEVPDYANETTLRFLENGEMIALVRREEGNKFGWIGASQPPYTQWKWQETGYRLGGPNFIILPGGSWWAGTRYYIDKTQTTLARMTRENLEPALMLPSGGDTSYPGMVFHDGLLWMSYYASHEGKTSIYLAKIRIPGR